MTLEVAAGTTDCFYLDNVKSGQTIDFEYQVGAGQGWPQKYGLIYFLLRTYFCSPPPT